MDNLTLPPQAAAGYKTRSEIKSISMPKPAGSNQYKRNFIIALDGGYSAVKGISEDMMFCFPSFAKKVSSGYDIISRPGPTDIILVDHRTMETWLVGGFAENTFDSRDAAAITDESLYTRYRYSSDVYRVIMMAGLGLGLFNTDADVVSDRLSIRLQTGLPTSYVKRDAGVLKKILAGDYEFSLRVGNVTKLFKFTLDASCIGVMEQPRGTLASIVYDKAGQKVPEITQILGSNVMILDIGFGTEDIFLTRSGVSLADNRNKTYSDTAMRAVFEAVLDEINEANGTSFKVLELQKYLKQGYIPVLRMGEIKTDNVPIAGLLEKHNRRLCEKSIRRLLEEYNNLLDYEYLVVSGGTGESRYAWIRDMLEGLSHLHVVAGNMADESIGCVYANARGYYMSMLLRTKKDMGA